MIIVAGTAVLRPEAVEEALQGAQRVITATEAEPGCISYQVYVHPLEQTKFLIFEEWETAEALTVHLQQPHIQQFFAYLSSILVGELQIQRYEVSKVTSL